MINSYKDLIVYQKAYESSLRIHEVSLGFPKFEQHELGSQIRRATKSIALNIAEGFGKRNSLAEFKRFLMMALGSNDEVSVQLDYCKDLGYISEEEYALYKARHVEIGKMLTKMLKDWQISKRND